MRRARGGGAGREPVVSGFIIDRERLAAAAIPDDADAPAQIVVCAPAGTGKTTLLAQLAARLRERRNVVCWLRLRPDDNDARHLLGGVLTALEGGLRHSGSDGAEELARLVVPAARIDEGFLGSVVDALSVSEQPAWLLLDDAHSLSPGAAMDTLLRLLDSAGSLLHTVFACRRDPPLQMARRILEGDAVEIRADRLAFDKGEAHALLHAHGVTLDDSDLATLLDRTEGWAAGLRLAALSLSQAEDPRHFLASFSGSRRPVADYLVSEVLRGLPADVRDFMVATSGPADLPVELAAVLSGRPDAGAVLERLVQANVLTTCTQTSPPTYRYHSLLRSYLSAESAARDLPAFFALHVRAAEYFDRAGLVPDALEHAALGHDWNLVLDLLRRHGLPLMLRGAQASVVRAIELLPPAQRAACRPSLLAAYASLHDGAVPTARSILDRFASPAETGDLHLAGLYAALRLLEARLSGARGPHVVTLLDNPQLADASAESLFLSAMRGMTRVDLNDIAAAEDELSRALHMSMAHGYDYLALACMSHLTLTAAASGHSVDMMTRAADVIAFASHRGWEKTAALTSNYFAAAWGAWSAMDEETTERNLAMAEKSPGGTEPRMRTYVRLLRAYVDRERTISLPALLRRLREIWAGTDESVLRPAGMSSLCLVELGYAEEAKDPEWIREVVGRAERCLDGTGDLEVIHASRHFRTGNPAAAQLTLEPVLQGRSSPTHARALLVGWQVECLSAHALGQPERAHAALLAMLDIAAPRFLVRPLVMAPAAISELLRAGRGRFGAHEDVVTRVLREVANRGIPDQRRPAHVPHLTEREETILRDLPSLLSLSDIAAAHHVTENTIKTHVRSIYDKLGVHNRREAVERADELGLF